MIKQLNEKLGKLIKKDKIKYVCQECDHKFSHGGDPWKAKCPKCKSTDLEDA